jgi:hypothetical protein
VNEEKDSANGKEGFHQLFPILTDKGKGIIEIFTEVSQLSELNF